MISSKSKQNEPRQEKVLNRSSLANKSWMIASKVFFSLVAITDMQSSSSCGIRVKELKTKVIRITLQEFFMCDVIEEKEIPVLFLLSL